jgi:hypothetical protein
VDAGCTPSGVLPAHLADQISDLARNDRSSRLAMFVPLYEKSSRRSFPIGLACPSPIPECVSSDESAEADKITNSCIFSLRFSFLEAS